MLQNISRHDLWKEVESRFPEVHIDRLFMSLEKGEPKNNSSSFCCSDSDGTEK